MKEKLGKQIFKNSLELTILIFLIEIVVRINIKAAIFDWSLLRIFISSVIIATIFGIIFSFIKNNTIKKIVKTIVSSVLVIYSWVEINLFTYLGFFMGLGNAEQAEKTTEYIKDYLMAAKWQSFLVLIPFIIYILYIWLIDKKIKEKRLAKTTYFIYKNKSIKRNIIALLTAIICLAGFVYIYYLTLKLPFMQNKLQITPNTTLILTNDNSNLNVSQFGLFVYGISDVNISLFNIEVDEEIIVSQNNDNRELTTPIDLKREIDDTAWNLLIENESSASKNKLNNFFINREITPKNSKTGIFEGKNLIIILMESTNFIAINEKEYPTIYKLWNEGISFRNNYSPRNNCSTGNNEMTVMTSLFTINKTCTANKYKNNIYPEAVFNLFNENGYVTTSYHDYADFYYSRKTIHKNMGSTKYYNASDLKIKWSSIYEEWPSDVDLMKSSAPYYMNEDKFMVFMSSVTPHQPYTVSSENGDKHLSEFSSYSYSTSVKRYMSKLKELDAALEELLYELDLAGKLDDTVIALFGDHYPYGLSTKNINEVLDYDVTINNEVDRTPMIIYNSATPKEEIYEYTTIIDLLPTLFNMFNLNYDPRLYLGHDVYSEYNHIAVFADGSWQNEVGYYNATTGKFNPKDENITYTTDELFLINNDINTRQKMSTNAIKEDYFNYLFENLNKYKPDEIIITESSTIESEE